MEEREPVNALVPMYANLAEQLELLPDDQERYKAFQVIYRYGIFEEEPPADISPLVKMIFLGIKPNIDAYYKRVKGGTKGGRPRKKKSEDNEPSEDDDENRRKNNINKPKVKPKVFTDKEKDKDKEIESDKDTDSNILYSLDLDLKKEKHVDRFPGDALEEAPRNGTGFSLNDCFQCRDINNIFLTDSQVKEFHERMTKQEWMINGSPVKILRNAMIGYSRNIVPRDPEEQAIQAIKNELLIRIENNKQLSGIYKGFCKMVSPAKFKRIMEKEVDDFITNPWESGFETGLLPDCSNINSEDIPGIMLQFIQEHLETTMTETLKGAIWSACYEIKNNIPDNNRLDPVEFVDKKIRKALTINEYELLEEWKMTPDKVL